jgi:benzoyl-CoA reductase/2-hydroxyglutaryl-CoA dehydratase subunit BcrC/BadD/HgdB
MALLGAWFFMERREYAALATRAAGEIARRPPLSGPRVLIKGTPLDHPALHAAIERHGAVVVAEDDWWGARSAGRDVANGDPLAAIFRKYYLDAPGPRVFPPAVADAWFVRESLRDIDGVVYYLPPDDDVLGWDYPRHRRFLEGHGVPVTLVREDAHHLSAAEHERLGEFVAGLSPRRPQRKANSLMAGSR